MSVEGDHIDFTTKGINLICKCTVVKYSSLGVYKDMMHYKFYQC